MAGPAQRSGPRGRRATVCVPASRRAPAAPADSGGVVLPRAYPPAAVRLRRLLTLASRACQVEGMLASKVVAAVACGAAHILALTADGGVFAWGYGGEGQLGLGATYDVPIPLPVALGLHVVQVSASAYQSAAVTSQGHLYTWGAGEDGRLGHGDLDARLVPTRVQALAHCVVALVSCGPEHMAALTDEGEVSTFPAHTHARMRTSADSRARMRVRGPEHMAALTHEGGANRCSPGAKEAADDAGTEAQKPYSRPRGCAGRCTPSECPKCRVAPFTPSRSPRRFAPL